MKYRLEWTINDVDDSLETVSPSLTNLCEAVLSAQACGAEEITLHALTPEGDVVPGSLKYLSTDQELRDFIKDILENAELE